MKNHMQSIIEKMPFIKDSAEKLFDEWSKKHKRANILIFGKTGVGKSTLINAVFRDNLASTGIGKPVTQEIEEITKAGMPITILDTKGLELSDYSKIKNDIINEVRNRQGEDLDKYIHLAWLCISEEGKRIENAEKDLAKSLKELNVGVIIVITKVNKFKDNDFEKVVRKEFSGLCCDVCLTRGVYEDIYGDDDTVTRRGIKGINDLISNSYRYIPESQKQSFANVLSIKNEKSLAIKKEEANKVINVAMVSAGTAAAAPLPFSDAVALVPIQVAMIIKISHTYGMAVDKSVILPALTALLGSSATTIIGRTVFASILKFIPGVGSLVGGVISAGIASQLTAALGKSYVEILNAMIENGQSLEISSALHLFQEKIGF